MNKSSYPSRYKRRGVTNRYSKKTYMTLQKQISRKNLNNGNLIFAKLRYIQSVDTSALETGIRFSFWGLDGELFNGAGSVYDWTNYSGIYDNFRVCGLKIEFIPQANATLIEPGTPSTIRDYAPIYDCFDYDNIFGSSGTTTQPTVAEMNEYENCKYHNQYRPWKRYYKIKKYTSMSSNVTALEGGFFPTATAAITSLPGGVYIRTETLSAPIDASGKFRCTYYVQFKNRK